MYLYEVWLINSQDRNVLCSLHLKKKRGRSREQENFYLVGDETQKQLERLLLLLSEFRRRWILVLLSQTSGAHEQELCILSWAAEWFSKLNTECSTSGHHFCRHLPEKYWPLYKLLQTKPLKQ